MNDNIKLTELKRERDEALRECDRLRELADRSKALAAERDQWQRIATQSQAHAVMLREVLATVRADESFGFIFDEREAECCCCRGKGPTRPAVIHDAECLQNRMDTALAITPAEALRELNTTSIVEADKPTTK